MFNSADLLVLQACLANYIELANAQKSALVIAKKDCALLEDFYSKKIDQCYHLTLKIERTKTQKSALAAAKKDSALLDEFYNDEIY